MLDLTFSQEGNRRIFPPLGKLEWVIPVSEPPFKARTRSRNARIAQGLKYEQQVTKRLEARYGAAWVPGPWFCYRAEDREQRKYCQLDGVLKLTEKKYILVEAKYSHCSDAYFQLTNLYLPIMQFLHPTTTFALCEVVKWYDPAIPFPCPITLLPDLHEAKEEGFSVHILNR